MTPTFPSSGGQTGVWGWPGLMWNVKKTPEFKTLIHPASSGRETRVAGWAMPRWHFTLDWEFLRDQRNLPMYDGLGQVLPAVPYDELRQIVGFFLARRGAYEPFFFFDPTDNAVANQTLAASSVAGAVNLQCIRSFAGQFVEPVGGVAAINKFLINGVQQSGAYLSTIQLNKYQDPVLGLIDQDGWIVLPSAPPAGALLVASFTYYFKARFEKDQAEFENFLDDLWRLQHLGLYSVRE